MFELSRMYTGSTFHIEMLFQTQNGTGTGEIDLDINTADGIPVVDDELEEPLKPGAYNVTWTVKAKPNPNCDPTQGPCEQWILGSYTANVGEVFADTHTHTHTHLLPTRRTGLGAVVLSASMMDFQSLHMPEYKKLVVGLCMSTICLSVHGSYSYIRTSRLFPTPSMCSYLQWRMWQ